MRYKFYREHKYVSFRLNELERLIAKTDFTDVKQWQNVYQEFQELKKLLEGHAHYENDCIHTLLIHKGKNVPRHIEDEHEYMNQDFSLLETALKSIDESRTLEDKIEKGYQFYLLYRKFVADNLIHLHEEEVLILPELQKLYSDEELRKVEFQTYKKMTVNKWCI